MEHFYLTSSRIEVRSNGRLLLGASVDRDPQTPEEIAAVLKELAAMLEAPSVSIFDSEIPE